jgi:YD repeat-containing protein
MQFLSVLEAVKALILEMRSSAAASYRDTDGNPVPVWKSHTYTYDASGNLKTDTVSDGDNAWVKTFSWDGGAQTGDSGWVKQHA